MPFPDKKGDMAESPLACWGFQYFLTNEDIFPIISREKLLSLASYDHTIEQSYTPSKKSFHHSRRREAERPEKNHKAS